VETALGALQRALIDLDEVILRNQQAMRRTGLVVDVLGPALERLTEIRGWAEIAKREMAAAWQENEKTRWEKP
jgi:hypothetical protein